MTTSTLYCTISYTPYYSCTPYTFYSLLYCPLYLLLSTVLSPTPLLLLYPLYLLLSTVLSPIPSTLYCTVPYTFYSLPVYAPPSTLYLLSITFVRLVSRVSRLFSSPYMPLINYYRCNFQYSYNSQGSRDRRHAYTKSDTESKKIRLTSHMCINLYSRLNEVLEQEAHKSPGQAFGLWTTVL